MKIKVKKIYLLIHIQAYTRLFDRECGHFVFVVKNSKTKEKKNGKRLMKDKK